MEPQVYYYVTLWPMNVNDLKINNKLNYYLQFRQCTSNKHTLQSTFKTNESRQKYILFYHIVHWSLGLSQWLKSPICLQQIILSYFLLETLINCHVNDVSLNCKSYTCFAPVFIRRSCLIRRMTNFRSLAVHLEKKKKNSMSLLF